MSSKISIYQALKRSGLFEDKQDLMKAVNSGRISIDGKETKAVKFQFNPKKKVMTLDGKPVEFVSSYYYVINKPMDYSCQKNDRDPFVVDLLQVEENVRNTLFPIGRLDVPTTGLLIITNDGNLSKILTDPKSEIEKTYSVLVRKKITDEQADWLREGVEIRLFESRYITKPAKVEIISDKEMLLTITEGKYRQIRKMCEEIENRVVDLQRVSIGPLQLGRLPLGNFKRYSKIEMENLFPQIKR